MDLVLQVLMLHVDWQFPTPAHELKVFNSFTLAELFQDLPKRLLGLWVKPLQNYLQKNLTWH
jgi:hypothetical protein